MLQKFPSPFQHRLWWKHHIGVIHTMNGKHFSLPLYHRRPPPPFEIRLTRTEKIELNAWLNAIPTISD